MSENSPIQVLQSFFREMQETEELYFRRVGGPREAEDPIGFWNRLMEDFRSIWVKWCAMPFGDKRPTSFGIPTEYGEGEIIDSCEISKDAAIVMTFGSPYFPKDRRVVHAYKLKLIDGQWRISSRHEVTESGKLKRIPLF